MKTYYICESVKNGKKRWTAHRQGILSAFGIFNEFNEVFYAASSRSADECEADLRTSLIKSKPRVVRVVKI